MDHIVVPNGMIRERVALLAKTILTDYEKKDLTLLVIMNGGNTFYNDLKAEGLESNDKTCVTVIHHKLTNFVEEPSIGKVTGIDEIDDDARKLELQGKNVLVIEDYYDSGFTMKCLLAKLETFELASLKTAVVFKKRNPLS